jgi:hypothetical protein
MHGMIVHWPDAAGTHPRPPTYTQISRVLRLTRITFDGGPHPTAHQISRQSRQSAAVTHPSLPRLFPGDQ